MAVLQSLAQARDRWGREAAQAIWDSAIVKVVLGGSANADDLADLSRLVGEREVREWSETRHRRSMDRSVSSSVRYRPVLEAAELRRLRFGTGLLLLRSAAPIVMALRAVDGPGRRGGPAGGTRGVGSRGRCVGLGPACTGPGSGRGGEPPTTPGCPAERG